MSLYGMMRTGVSGMNAQSNRLGTVADNIANSGTTGYKRSSTEFSSLVLPGGSGSYSSGAVKTTIRHEIGREGALLFTNSATDLSLNGNGFFVVNDASGKQFMTRAGSFVQDKNGQLVNAAGYRLMGYDLSGTAAGRTDPVPITLGGNTIETTPTTRLSLVGNLPFQIEGGQGVSGPPSSDRDVIYYNHRTHVSGRSADGIDGGSAEIFYTKLEDDVWEITVRKPRTDGTFDSRSTVLTFDPASGEIVAGNPILSFADIDPDGSTYDFSAMMQSQQPDSSRGGVQMSTSFFTDIPPIDPAQLRPSENVAGSNFTHRYQVTGFTGEGRAVALDVYATKVDDDRWEIAAFDRSTATAGGFPYGAPGSQPLALQEINFDPASGQLIDYEALSIELPNGQRMSFDLSGSIAEPDITPVMPVTTRFTFDLSSLQPVYEPQPVGIVAPSSNFANATFHGRTSAIAIGNLGQEVPLDIYFAKLENGLWEVSVFDASNGHSFPYNAPALTSQFLSFDPDNGRLLDGGSMTFNVPGGQETTVDLSRFSELALEFNAYADGNDGLRPSFASDFEISEEGIVYALYGSGERKALYQIALANVASADQLSVHAGNVFAASAASGELVLGTATNGSFGKIISGALESSNVDIAEELTSMIEAQRNYTANSKVFQTGSELLDVLVNLKR